MLLDKDSILKPGVDIKSVSGFADSMGVTSDAIYAAIKRGDVDYVDLGTHDKPLLQVVLTETTLAYAPNGK
ncbi:MAG: hypothetical protein H6550_16095 [Chitinophagales bacterium]|nr:hypothetical protein [Chitinophagales bacterium]